MRRDGVGGGPGGKDLPADRGDKKPDTGLGGLQAGSGFASRRLARPVLRPLASTVELEDVPSSRPGFLELLGRRSTQLLYGCVHIRARRGRRSSADEPVERLEESSEPRGGGNAHGGSGAGRVHGSIIRGSKSGFFFGLARAGLNYSRTPRRRRQARAIARFFDGRASVRRRISR